MNRKKVCLVFFCTSFEASIVFCYNSSRFSFLLLQFVQWIEIKQIAMFSLFITPGQHFLTWTASWKPFPSAFTITGTFTVDDDEITKTLHRVHQEHHYILCPHTAVAAAYHYRCVFVGGDRMTLYPFQVNFLVIFCTEALVLIILIIMIDIVN